MKKSKSFDLDFLAPQVGLEPTTHLLRCPKFANRLERGQILTAAPSSPRFTSHCESFGDDAVNSRMRLWKHKVVDLNQLKGKQKRVQIYNNFLIYVLYAICDS